MSRTSQAVLDRVEGALSLIEEGRLEDAEREIEQARAKAPDAAEVHYALGTLASAHGDVDEAIARFLDAADRDPEWPVPLLAAGWEELERDDAERALDIADEVLEAWPKNAEACVDAMLLRAEAHLDLEDVDAARAALSDIDTAKIEPQTLLDVATMWCACGEHGREEGVLRGLVEREPDNADGLHALGACLHDRQEHDEATELWLKVRELDVASPRSPLALSDGELEAIAEAALRELPEEVRARLANVPILVEEMPSVELVQEGLDPRILGLFTGTPLPHKGTLEGQPHAPDSAILFLRNLEAACIDREELAEQVRITILHETAHFFGLEDDDLDALGLG